MSQPALEARHKDLQESVDSPTDFPRTAVAGRTNLSLHPAPAGLALTAAEAEAAVAAPDGLASVVAPAVLAKGSEGLGVGLQADIDVVHKAAGQVVPSSPNPIRTAAAAAAAPGSSVAAIAAGTAAAGGPTAEDWWRAESRCIAYLLSTLCCTLVLCLIHRHTAIDLGLIAALASSGIAMYAAIKHVCWQNMWLARSAGGGGGGGSGGGGMAFERASNTLFTCAVLTTLPVPVVLTWQLAVGRQHPEDSSQCPTEQWHESGPLLAYIGLPLNRSLPTGLLVVAKTRDHLDQVWLGSQPASTSLGGGQAAPGAAAVANTQRTAGSQARAAQLPRKAAASGPPSGGSLAGAGSGGGGAATAGVDSCMADRRQRIRQHKLLAVQEREEKLRLALRELAGHEEEALLAFERAEKESDRVGQDQAHLRWMQAYEKIQLLTQNPQQFEQRYGGEAGWSLI